VNADLECIRHWSVENHLTLNVNNTQAIVVYRGEIVLSEPKLSNWGITIFRTPIQCATWAHCHQTRLRHLQPPESFQKSNLSRPEFVSGANAYCSYLPLLRCFLLSLPYWKVRRLLEGYDWRSMHASDIFMAVDTLIISPTLQLRYLDVSFSTYLEVRLACFIHRIHLSASPPYLAALLRFDSLARHRQFVAPRPTPTTSKRSDSTIYRGIRLWNFLPASVRSS
jgi:hypothetical protein